MQCESRWQARAHQNTSTILFDSGDDQRQGELVGIDITHCRRLDELGSTEATQPAIECPHCSTQRETLSCFLYYALTRAEDQRGLLLAGSPGLLGNATGPLLRWVELSSSLSKLQLFTYLIIRCCKSVSS